MPLSRSKLALRQRAWRARFAPRLIIMVKEPVAGRVKTRLAQGVGTTLATAFYRHMVHTLARRLGRDTRWHTLLSVAPDRAIGSKALPRGIARLGQGSGDIGARLGYLFGNAPRGPVVIIGTDIPAIRAEDIAAGFRALRAGKAVIGPSRDGGYWLIGLTATARRHARLTGVRWSTAHARADTEACLAAFKIVHVTTLDDVDTPDDLHRQRRVIGRLHIAPDVAPRR